MGIEVMGPRVNFLVKQEIDCSQSSLSFNSPCEVTADEL